MSDNNNNNNNTEPPRSRKTGVQLDKELAHIERLISNGYTDSEIMNELKLKRSRYYLYKKKIFRRSAELQKQKGLEVIGFEQQVLKDRLIRLFRICESRALDRNTETEDVALIVTAAEDIAINLLKLETEGLRVSNAQSIGERGLNYNVRKVIELAGPSEEEKTGLGLGWDVNQESVRYPARVDEDSDSAGEGERYSGSNGRDDNT